MPRLAAAVLLALPLAALAQGPQPGNWELSITSLLTGQPKPAAATQTRCLTEADARDPGNVLGGQGTCTFSNKNDVGGMYTFDVSCTGLLPMKGRGKVAYTASTLQGELDLTADGGATPFVMQTILQGRRLGPC